MNFLSRKKVLAVCLLSCVSLSMAGCAPASNQGDEVETEGENVPIPELTPAEKADNDAMTEPSYSKAEESAVLQKYSTIDPGHVIPDTLLRKALTYYDANQSHITNKAYLTIVDFKPHSKYARLFLITMSTGAVWSIHVAHGSGSDPKRTGYATKFSNQSGSLMSTLGFFKTAETYNGKHGRSLRLDGLSSSNSNTRSRAIVVHSAAYVHDSNSTQGWSSGCFAVSQANKDKLVDAIKAGSLMYADVAAD